MPKDKDFKSTFYYVSESSIHGKGLFAKKDIKKGTVIGKVKGKKTKDLGEHVLWIEDKNHGILVNCELKYINHSNEPNAAYYDDLTVVALTNIKADEELTHDYGEEWQEEVVSEEELSHA